MPICRICGRELRFIAPAHLQTHGLTTIEYKERFPDAVFASDELNRRNAETSRGLMKQRWVDGTMDSALEYFRSPETREKRSKQAKQLWAEGKYDHVEWRGEERIYWEGLSEDERQTIMRQHRSDAAKKLHAAGIYDDEFYQRTSASLKQFYQTEEGLRNRSQKAEQMGETMREWHADPENKEWFCKQRSDYMIKLLQNSEEVVKRVAWVSSNEPTDIEIILYEILNDLGVSYQKQVIIDHYIVDAFVEGWLVLEAYGEYWHGDERPIQQEHDQVRNERLQRLGFQVFPFWGNELKQTPGLCADKITYMVDCT